jgi:hypothetical protein
MAASALAGADGPQHSLMKGTEVTLSDGLRFLSNHIVL